MSEARSRRLATLALVAALLTAGLLGTVDATQQVEQQHLTTGHSEFADASTAFNSCFAGLAGLLMQRVTWFNGQTLFTRADSGGDKHVYVTEHLEGDYGENNQYNYSTGFKVNEDPSNKRLYRTNNTYTFTDPNADPNDPDPKQWVVKEYFELRERLDTHVHTGTDGEHQKTPVKTKDKFYVFVVETGQARTDSTLQKDYNFAMVIDTCRFSSGQTGNTTHNGTVGTSGDPWGQHQDNDGNHTHGIFSIDIWVGGAPNTPAGGAVEVPDDRGNESARNDTKDGQP